MSSNKSYYHEKQFESPVRMRILRALCERLNWRLEVLQPREGFLVRIWNGERFVNHKTNVCTLNSYRATDICRDKVYTYLLLQEANVRVPKGDYYFRPGYFTKPDFSIGRGKREAIVEGLALGMNWTHNEAEDYLKNNREDVRFIMPLVVKPNSLSQGKGISRVDLLSELEPAINRVFDVGLEADYIVIVQEFVTGKEYRLVLLDGALELCYEKKYFSIIGNGRDSIASLISEANERLTNRGEKSGGINLDHPVLMKILLLENLSCESVLEDSRELILNNVTSNLETGAQAIDRTDAVGSDYIELARKIAKELQLRYLGIDLRCIDIREPAVNAIVIEVNGNPGLTHWFLQGHVESVLSIYEKLFKKMFQQEQIG